jgi:hypothetical protein
MDTTITSTGGTFTISNPEASTILEPGYICLNGSGYQTSCSVAAHSTMGEIQMNDFLTFMGTVFCTMLLVALIVGACLTVQCVWNHENEINELKRQLKPKQSMQSKK